MPDRINHGSMEETFHDAFELFCRKNKNYGNSFERSLDRRGITAALVRMDDKTNRIDSLVEQDEDADPDDESLIDTLIDLGNYAFMTATYLREKGRAHE